MRTLHLHHRAATGKHTAWTLFIVRRLAGHAETAQTFGAHISRTLREADRGTRV